MEHFLLFFLRLCYCLNVLSSLKLLGISAEQMIELLLVRHEKSRLSLASQRNFQIIIHITKGLSVCLIVRYAVAFVDLAGFTVASWHGTPFCANIFPLLWRVFLKSETFEELPWCQVKAMYHTGSLWPDYMASLQFPLLITGTLPILGNWKNSEPVTAKSRLSAK